MLRIRVVPWEEDEEGVGYATTVYGFPCFNMKAVSNKGGLEREPFHRTPDRAAFLDSMEIYTAFILHPDGGDRDHWIYVVRQWAWWKTGLLLAHELLHWVAWFLPGEWLHEAIDWVPKRREA